MYVSLGRIRTADAVVSTEHIFDCVCLRASIFTVTTYVHARSRLQSKKGGKKGPSQVNQGISTANPTNAGRLRTASGGFITPDSTVVSTRSPQNV